jgi:hypothetical protein
VGLRQIVVLGYLQAVKLDLEDRFSALPVETKHYQIRRKMIREHLLDEHLQSSKEQTILKKKERFVVSGNQSCVL